MTEEANKKGTFVGSVIGAIMMTALAGGGAGYGASQVGEAELKAEQAAQERLFQKYIDEVLLPELDESLDEELAELEADFQEGLDQCLKNAAEADKQAFAALEAVRMRFGARTVEKALDVAEEEVPTSPPPFAPSSKMGPVKTMKKAKTSFQKYQQQVQMAGD